MPLLGGVSDEVKPADETVNGLVEKVRKDLETKSGENFEEFTAVSYKSQLVAGTNYFVKVKVGADVYTHLRIYQPLTGEPELSAYQLNKTKDDEIESFS